MILVGSNTALRTVGAGRRVPLVLACKISGASRVPMLPTVEFLSLSVACDIRGPLNGKDWSDDSPSQSWLRTQPKPLTSCLFLRLEKIQPAFPKVWPRLLSPQVQLRVPLSCNSLLPHPKAGFCLPFCLLSFLFQRRGLESSPKKAGIAEIPGGS